MSKTNFKNHDENFKSFEKVANQLLFKKFGDKLSCSLNEIQTGKFLCNGLFVAIQNYERERTE